MRRSRTPLPSVWKTTHDQIEHVKLIQLTYSPPQQYQEKETRVCWSFALFSSISYRYLDLRVNETSSIESLYVGIPEIVVETVNWEYASMINLNLLILCQGFFLYIENAIKYVTISSGRNIS